ncbi:hypothetical protein CUMW_147880 [Citrus unshiu]|uniref:Uncharacterized protein n=1 Tax=Citrus unshiu TaxID=55188 RepID=A0A2H5PLK7_CITUN|nr:hypothetical protein CUMW_147880 [Citrus unshiu]
MTTIKASNVPTPLSSEVDIVVPTQESNKDPQSPSLPSHPSMLPYSSSWISYKGSQQGSFQQLLLQQNDNDREV